jgi:carboxymethylenebutenolidase
MRPAFIGGCIMRRLPVFAAAVVFAVSLMPAVFAQAGGARGVVDRKLQGVQDYNQSIEDAINGKDDNKISQQPAQAAPAAVKTGWITRKSRDGKKDVRLYFAEPAGLSKTKPAPGLLVLQEWWGVNDDIQERTRDFAAKGFYAVAPDLYDGKVTDNPDEAAKLKDAMKDADAMTDMKTGLDLFDEEAHNGVLDAKHVGVVGWCMGGQQALLLSIADGRVKATGIFYGPLVTDSSKLRVLSGPIFGVFGNDDKNPSPDDVKKFKDALPPQVKKDLTIYQYDGVGHAFASKSAAKMGAYNEEKAKDAFAKLDAWLDAKLPRK